VGVSFICKSKFRGLENIERKHVMKMRLAALFAVVLMARTFPAMAQTYDLTDLGAVQGDTVSVGYGLNGVGQAAGSSSNPSAAIATLFSKGKAINLGLLEPGDVSVATGISDSEVVGFEYFSSVPGNTAHAWLYSNGVLTDIHSPTLFPQGTKSVGINSSGVVVGQGWLTSSSFHVFAYANGQMVDIGPPGSFQAAPTAINDAGQIVGNYFTSSTDSGAFLYFNGKFTNLGAPAGTTTSASAINSTGQIAGQISFNSGAPSHAAVWNNGVWTDLGGFTGATGTSATGINMAGQVIGTAGFPVTSYHPFIPAKSIACIIRNGSVVDLNKLIPGNSGFNLSRAIAINDAGQVLCNAKTQIGTKVSNQHAVLLTPK
jgi:probable HAF family extracellular repeat protein